MSKKAQQQIRIMAIKAIKEAITAAKLSNKEQHDVLFSIGFELDGMSSEALDRAIKQDGYVVTEYD